MRTVGILIALVPALCLLGSASALAAPRHVDGEGVAFALDRGGFGLAAFYMRSEEGEAPRAFLRVASRVFRLVAPEWRRGARQAWALSAGLRPARRGEGQDEASSEEGSLSGVIEAPTREGEESLFRGSFTLGERSWRLLARLRLGEPSRVGPGAQGGPARRSGPMKPETGPLAPPSFSKEAATPGGTPAYQE